MSPGGLPCLSSAHFLSNLISLSISLVSYLFRRHNLQGVFLPWPGERNAYSRGRGRPGSARGGGWSVPYTSPMAATDALAEKFLPDTPPVVQNYIPGTQIHSPENSRKIWKSGLFDMWWKAIKFSLWNDDDISTQVCSLWPHHNQINIGKEGNGVSTSGGKAVCSNCGTNN